MRTKIPNLYIITLLTLLALAACRPTPPPATPPPPVEPTILATIEPTPVQVISIQPELIRLTDKSKDSTITADMLWIIPINVETNQGVGFRAQYLNEDEQMVISHTSPQRLSDWFISIKREDLNGEDFGLWFIVVGGGDAWRAVRSEFSSLVTDSFPFLATSLATIFLTGATPGLPDELVTAVATATRGEAILGRIQALGNLLPNVINHVNQKCNNNIIACGIATNLATEAISNLASASLQIDQASFFSEAYVTFSATDDYRLNNKLSVVTTDGSIQIEFLVFETSNTAQLATQLAESYLPEEECNPSIASNLISGMIANVTITGTKVRSSPIDDSADIIEELAKDQTVTTLYPYCEQERNTLWWRVRTESGKVGWIAEHGPFNIFLEPANDG